MTDAGNLMEQETRIPWCDRDSATELYASRFSGAVGSWLLDVQRQALSELLTLPPGSSVLDVGGGHAQLTPFLLTAGYRVTIHGSCPEAKGRASPFIEAGHCRWSEGPLDTLPYDTASFDVVVSFRIVPHVDDWPRYLAELCRVARVSVIIDYPTARSINIVSSVLFQLKLKIEKTTRRYRIFRDVEIQQVLTQSGFSPKREVRQFLFPLALHRLLRNRWLSEQIEKVGRWLGATRCAGSPVVIRGDRIR